MRRSSPRRVGLLRGMICGCLAMVSIAGCQGTASPTVAVQPPAETLSAEERLVRVWRLLDANDPASFREALAELATLPREVYHDPGYGVDGPPDWEILKVGDTSVRLDGWWIITTVRRFGALLEAIDPKESRRQYEAFDALLAGVMRSARKWQARRPYGMPPLAYHFAMDLRAVLARLARESGKFDGDAEFVQLLQDRRERLLEVGAKSLTRIVEDVP